MKKLFAILFVFALATSFSFATDDTWTSTGTHQGTLTATVYCVPAITEPEIPALTANVFVGQTSTTGWSWIWKITGPTAATYNPTVGYSTVTNFSYGTPDIGWTVAHPITGIKCLANDGYAEYKVSIPSITGISETTGQALIVTFSLSATI